jgi:heme-degrading monooxygenase HmoA
MIVILFRSRLTGLAGEDYAAMDAHMLERARAAPGFVDVKSYTAADGERLTIVRWRDRETLRRWREDAEHRVAQATGRRLWYEWYDMEVAEVIRGSRFDREAKPVHAAEGAEG